MKTPDVTPVQKLVSAVVALVGATFALLAAFGVDVSAEQSGAVLAFLGALGSVFVLADAIIRNGRAKNVAAVMEAKAVQAHAETLAAEKPAEAEE